MSNFKDTHSKYPKQRPSDSSSLSTLRQTSWRTGQNTPGGEVAEDKVTRSPSDSSSPGLTTEFLARVQQGGRNRTNITITPTHGQGKKQSDRSKGSSSSTDNSDGGVLLNANNPQPTANEHPNHGSAKDIRPPGGQSSNDLSSTGARLNTAPSSGVNVNTPKVKLSHPLKQARVPKIPGIMSPDQNAIRVSYSILPQPISPYQTAQYRAIIIDFEDTLGQIPNLSKAASEIIHQKFSKVLLDFSSIHHRLNQEIERNTGEHDKTRGRMNALLQQLDAVMRDRKRIASERDSYQIQVNEFALRPGDVTKPFRDLEKKLRQEIAELREQIRLQEEQLKGRRALWMDVNSHSESRRRAMSSIQDPFDTPSKPPCSGTGGDRMSGSKSQKVSTPFTGASPYTSHEGGEYQSRVVAPNSTTPFAPPGLAKFSTAPASQSPSSSMRTSGDSFASPAPLRGNRGDTFTYPNMQRGKASRRKRNNQCHDPTMSNDASNSPKAPASLRRYSTEPSPSTAMVPYVQDDERYLEYKEGLNKLYELAQNWARSYAFHPDPSKEQEVVLNDQSLWDFMMNCTYPGHLREAHAHVMAMLGDYSTRLWFVTRMAITYCIQDIMAIDAFKLFNSQVAEAIENAKVKNQDRGLANDARQILVEYQVAAFQSMLASSDYEGFRQTQLTDHSMRLQEILRPMINMDSSLLQASQEIEAMVVAAWDQAIKMHTSHITFQIYFPETSAKFSAATMIAINSPEDPLNLQVSQARLKLVATPVITVRDDRGTTIITKNLHRSTVMIAD